MNKIYLYNTGSYAKERLISMLASDRIGCNPDFLDDMKHTIKQEAMAITLVSLRSEETGRIRFVVPF